MKKASFFLNQWSDFKLYLGAHHTSGVPHFFMTAQTSKGLLSSFDTWKENMENIKKKSGVAQLNEPLVSKDSRENLHDTSNATDAIKDWRTFWKDVLDVPGTWDCSQDELTKAINQQKTMTKQKTVDNFLDEICCALEELSGKEVFDCFVEAVQGQFDYTKKEHDKTSELLDLLTGLK